MRSARISATIALGAATIVLLASSAAGQSRDEQAIRALSQEWQQAIAAGNVDRIVAIHAPSAVVMMANSPTTTGSAAVRALYNDMVKLPGLVMHWTTTKIEMPSPTVATEYGTYTDAFDSPTGRLADSGTYVAIWNKINGQWRVALDAPVSTMPPAPSAPVESAEMETHAASALAWTDLTAAGFASGAKIALLHGNPSGTGRFVLRLQLPDGYMIPPHWHPGAEYVTVLSGRLDVGAGGVVDMTSTQSYAAGDFAYVPARHAHFGKARGATIIEVSGEAPFALNLGAPPSN
jgi:ketosteroid isomerase-like protein/quercetin dioxygenase-like cupin family protein